MREQQATEKTQTRRPCKRLGLEARLQDKASGHLCSKEGGRGAHLCQTRALSSPAGPKHTLPRLTDLEEDSTITETALKRSKEGPTVSWRERNSLARSSQGSVQSTQLPGPSPS